MFCYSFGPYKPNIAQNAFIAPSAVIIGRVRIEEGTSVWYNCVLRGDVSNIRLGRNTNIQDGCTLHGAEKPVQLDVEVGNHVIVGHNAIIHGCKIGDRAFIGMGAIILNRAVIGEGAIIGAGTLVPQGKVIPPYVLAVGVPARVIRPVTEEEKQRAVTISEAYYHRAKLYKQAVKQIPFTPENGGG